MNAVTQSPIEELSRLREIWRGFLDAAPAGVAILDHNMRYLEASARWKEDFGLTEADVVGRSHYDVFPEIPERWKEVHRRCLAGATERNDAEAFPRADGSVDWVRWEIRPWHLNDDEIGGIVIYSEVVTKRVEAEKALQASEARYRALIEQAPEAILIFDIEIGRFVDANRNAEQLFGCDREALLAGGPQRFYLADQPDGSIVSETFVQHNRAVANGESVSFQRHIRNAAGVMKIVEVRLSPLPSNNGRLARASMIDISDRVRAETALREREALYRGLVEQQIAGVAIVRDDGALAYVNPHFASIAGAPAADLIGQPLIGMVPLEERGRVMERLAGQFGDTPDDGFVQLVSKMVSRTGETRDILVNASRSEYAGRPASTAVVLDITERKRNEDELRDSQIRFSTVFHDSPASIAILDLGADGKILDVNRAFLEMLGLQHDDVVGRTAVDLNLWIDLNVRDAMYRTLAGPSGLASDEVQFHDKDGATVEVALTLRRIELGGKPIAIALAQDITKRKRAERAERRMTRAVRTLSAGNEVVVRATDEQNLLDQMCHVVVAFGGYKAAAIRFAENDADKTLRLVAHAGVPREALASTKLTWGDASLGQGPSGLAMRTGQVQVNQDYVNYPYSAPWLGALTEAGIASNIALPLRNGSVFGVLTIYATEVNAFDAEEIRLLTELADDLAFGILAMRDRKEGAEHALRLREGMRSTIGALAQTMETRDTYTAGHQRRVADLSAAIARELGLSDDRSEGLYFAAQLHDIGKISVPSEFLTKPSRLSAAEFEVIKGHVQAGYDILKGINFPWPVAEIAYQHHERLDGRGYPRGLKGDEILLEARILGVADVTESMTSSRPYRRALGLEAALAEIESGKGTLFDPAVVDACVRLMREKGFKIE